MRKKCCVSRQDIVLASVLILVGGSGLAAADFNCDLIGLTNLQGDLCFNRSELAVYEGRSLPREQALLLPKLIGNPVKFCSLGQSRKDPGSCKPIKFVLAPSDYDIFLTNSAALNRIKRQIGRANNNKRIINPLPPPKDTKPTVVMIDGIKWLCEKVTEIQCRPLREDKNDQRANQSGDRRVVVVGVRPEDIEGLDVDGENAGNGGGDNPGAGDRKIQDGGREAPDNKNDSTPREISSGGNNENKGESESNEIDDNGKESSKDPPPASTSPSIKTTKIPFGSVDSQPGRVGQSESQGSAGGFSVDDVRYNEASVVNDNRWNSGGSRGSYSPSQRRPQTTSPSSGQRDRDRQPQRDRDRQPQNRGDQSQTQEQRPNSRFPDQQFGQPRPNPGYPDNQQRPQPGYPDNRQRPDSVTGSGPVTRYPTGPHHTTDDRVQVTESGDVIIDGHTIHWQPVEGGSQQAVYRINGITWVCRQETTVNCHPLLDSPSRETGHGQHSTTTSTTTPPAWYPITPLFTPFTTRRPFTPLTYVPTSPPAHHSQNRRPETSGQDRPSSGGSRRPSASGRPDQQTTFCSRAIKFEAKNEVLLKFSTYDGPVRLYIKGRRVGSAIELRSNILRDDDEEILGVIQNSPPIVLKTVINCDTIKIRVDGKIYYIDYDFGRDGVKDLEVVGDLDTTGMVPRQSLQDQDEGRQYRNFMTKQDHHDILLEPVLPPGLSNERPYTPADDDYRYDPADHSSNPSVWHSGSTGFRRPPHSYSSFPTSTTTTTTTTTRSTTLWGVLPHYDDHHYPNYPSSEYGSSKGPIYISTSTQSPFHQGEDDLSNEPVTADNLQVTGAGEVEVSLEEKGAKEHRYRITKGDDGEINIEILFGEEAAEGNKTLVIDNKDYNYTLVVTGENIQIIHHDTNKNLTFNHGIQDSLISGVGVRGNVNGTSIAFKEGEGEASPQIQVDPRPVSIYGTICRSPCEPFDGIYYCLNNGNGTELCSPEPGYTPSREKCLDECRTRGDMYYWCHTRTKPWDYCSPKATFEEFPVCYQDSPPQRKRDIDDCSRYVECEKGEIKLKECAEGLHFIQQNNTCQWPDSQECESIRGLLFGGTDGGRGNGQGLQDGGADTGSSGQQDLRQVLQQAETSSTSLTTHGEICLDECDKRGYTYFWCKKKSSKLGQWWESDFCSPDPTITHYGENCLDKCAQRGEKYFWCHKSDGGWGYCSPKPIYKQGSCSIDGSYALDGDCKRYIKCEQGTPSLQSCQRNFKFDYISQECRFERISRCVGDSIENFP